MKYMCLIFMDATTLSILSTAERAAWAAAQRAYNLTLTQRGLLRSAETLQPADTAVTVRVEAGHVSVSEGAAMQSSEQLGEVYALDARDLNEAIRIAAQMPSARLGRIEIRPVE